MMKAERPEALTCAAAALRRWLTTFSHARRARASEGSSDALSSHSGSSKTTILPFLSEQCFSISTLAETLVNCTASQNRKK